MEQNNQGLDLRSSKEMFTFAICEASFMVSMGMSYFYSWQVYSDPGGQLKEGEVPEVVACDLKEVVTVTVEQIK